MKIAMIPVLMAAAAFLFSGCDSGPDWGTREQFEAEHEAAMRAKCPGWKEYRAAMNASENLRYAYAQNKVTKEVWIAKLREAAEIARAFPLDYPMSENELKELQLTLGIIQAPASETQRVQDEFDDRDAPGWAKFVVPARAEAWTEATAAAKRMDPFYLKKISFERRARIYHAAMKAGDTAFAGQLRGIDDRIHAEWDEADRYMKRAKAEAAARDAARGPAQPGAPGVAFDFQGTPDKKPAAEARRCARCLGSGKAGYVTNSTEVKLDAFGKPLPGAVHNVCPECNGTGYR